MIAIIRSNADQTKVETELRDESLADDVAGDIYGGEEWPEDGYDALDHNDRTIYSIMEPGVFWIVNGELVPIPTELEEVEDSYFTQEEAAE